MSITSRLREKNRREETIKSSEPNPLTKDMLEKFYNSVMNTNCKPTGYIDADGYHKINAQPTNKTTK